MALIQEAVGFHIEGLREHGEPAPSPATESALVEMKVV